MTAVVQQQPAQVYVAPTSMAYPNATRQQGNQQQGGQQQNNQRAPPARRCAFCSGTGHYVRYCEHAEAYVNDGRLRRDPNTFKLSLHDGRMPPPHVRGQNLRELFDNYFRELASNNPARNQQQATTSANYLEGDFESVFAVDVSLLEPSSSSSDPASSDEVDRAKRIQLLQAQIESLGGAQVYANQQQGRKEVFDGVYPPPIKYGPPRNVQRDAPAKAPEQPAPNVFARPPPPRNAGQPGAQPNNNHLPRGPMKPVEYPAKPQDDDKKTHFRSSIESSIETKSLISRALDAQVTLTAGELMAVSPDVRRQIKDMVTSKRVAVNMVDSDDIDYDIASCFETQPESRVVDLSRYEAPSTAHASLPLRVIYPSFGHGVTPECILDGGAQVVIMRRDVWAKLNFPITANKSMRMESANSSTYQTLGMLENIPITLGSVTVKLQIQVVDDAPFEVLLGRPFFDILSASERSKPGGHHSLEIRDPSDGTPYVFLTKPRMSNFRHNPAPAAAPINFP